MAQMYFAIMLDRASAGPVIIACSEGGTSIEDLAEQFPDKIIKVPININTGITDADAAKVRARGRGTLGLLSHQMAHALCLHSTHPSQRLVCLIVTIVAQ